MKIVINNDVFRKMSYWVQKAPGEISGLGIIKVEPGGILRVTKTVLLPQKNGPASTDIEPEDVCRAMFQFKDDADGSLRWWWHSHVNMGVFWSGTDTATIKSFGGTGPDSWIVSTVINKKNEWKNSVYVHHGKKMPWGEVEPLFLDDVTTEVETLDNPLHTLWDEEYDSCVKKYVPPVSVYPDYSSNRGNWTNPTMARIGVTTTADSGVSEDMRKAAEAAHYASGRPTGMSKKQWGKIKRAQLERETLKFVQNTKKSKTDDIGCDSYGYTKEDWKLLTEEGFDIDIVDSLLFNKFDSTQILTLADLCATPEYVLSLSYEGKEPEEIIKMIEEEIDSIDEENANYDDTPVADRRRG
jgi:hypothetical protein